jgi:hypothetical protein
MGHRRKQGRVPKQNVMQFVHYQHQKLFRGAGVLPDEFGIDQQSRLHTAFHRGGGYRSGLDNVHKAKQRRKRVGAAWEAIQDAFRNGTEAQFAREHITELSKALKNLVLKITL